MAARRHSAEERAGSFYRKGRKSTQPPRGMSPAGRRIWREIIASKPVDWFDADPRQELMAHCENRARLNDLMQRLAKEDVGSRAFRQLAINMKMISTMLVASSRQLRLSVHAATDRGSTKLTEHGSATGADDDLVGGAATRGHIRAVK
jgi:hypothetical protein